MYSSTRKNPFTLNILDFAAFLFTFFLLFCHCFCRLLTFVHTTSIVKYTQIRTFPLVLLTYRQHQIQFHRVLFRTPLQRIFTSLFIYFFLCMHYYPLTCTQNPQELSSTRSAKITAQWAALLPLMDNGGSNILNYRFVCTFALNEI